MLCSIRTAGPDHRKSWPRLFSYRATRECHAACPGCPPEPPHRRQQGAHPSRSFSPNEAVQPRRLQPPPGGRSAPRPTHCARNACRRRGWGRRAATSNAFAKLQPRAGATVPRRPPGPQPERNEHRLVGGLRRRTAPTVRPKAGAPAPLSPLAPAPTRGCANILRAGRHPLRNRRARRRTARGPQPCGKRERVDRRMRRINPRHQPRPDPNTARNIRPRHGNRHGVEPPITGQSPRR